MTVDLIDFADGIVELADCGTSDQNDNGDCFDLADDSGVELYNTSIDSPDSCMKGDMSRDLTTPDQFGPVRQTPTPGFPARCQPGLESRDQDAAGDSRLQLTELANHSTPNEVVVIDDAVHTYNSANHERPARAKRRPAWLEEFVAKITRSTGQHCSHSASCCQAVWTSPSSLSSFSSSSTSSSSYYCRSIREVFRVPEHSSHARIMDRQSTSTVTIAASAGASEVSVTATESWKYCFQRGDSAGPREDPSGRPFRV